jgi:Uma2 family endonuclease
MSTETEAACSERLRADEDGPQPSTRGGRAGLTLSAMGFRAKLDLLVFRRPLRSDTIMSTLLSPAPRGAIVYPDDDGNPMSDNTWQFEWIVSIKEGLEALFALVPDIFVAGNLLWYPVEGEPKIRNAPDVLVAFNRPKGRRGSYKQWEEGGIAPHVVFEILSPGNRFGEMLRKFQFYERYGVEEYYIYDPDDGSLEGWLRRPGRGLEEISEMAGFTSPRLGIRFEPGGGPNNLVILRPDGQRFLTYLEVMDRLQFADNRAQAERQRADEQTQAAEAERQRADAERQRADEQSQVADAERQRADEQSQVAARLAARLRELGINPD